MKKFIISVSSIYCDLIAHTDTVSTVGALEIETGNISIYNSWKHLTSSSNLLFTKEQINCYSSLKDVVFSLLYTSIPSFTTTFC